MEDGEFALIFRPHPREFAISRGEKSANARGSGPGGGGGWVGALGAAPGGYSGFQVTGMIEGFFWV